MKNVDYKKFFQKERHDRIKKFLENPPKLDISIFEKAEIDSSDLPREVQMWWGFLNDEERIAVLEGSILYAVGNGVDPNDLTENDVLSGISQQYYASISMNND